MQVDNRYKGILYMLLAAMGFSLMGGASFCSCLQAATVSATVLLKQVSSAREAYPNP